MRLAQEAAAPSLLRSDGIALMCAGEPPMTAGNNQPAFKIDFARFDENRRKIPHAQLLPYAGQQVAFSADGTRVVAHGADHQALEGQLQALGLDSSEVVWSYIPALDEETWL